MHQLRDGEMLRLVVEALIHRNDGVRSAAYRVVSFIEKERLDLIGKFVSRLSQFILRSVPLHTKQHVLAPLLAVLANTINNTIALQKHPQKVNIYSAITIPAIPGLTSSHPHPHPHPHLHLHLHLHLVLHLHLYPHLHLVLHLHLHLHLSTAQSSESSLSISSSAVAAAEAAACFWLCSLSRQCRYECLKILISLREVSTTEDGDGDGDDGDGANADFTSKPQVAAYGLGSSPSSSSSQRRRRGGGHSSRRVMNVIEENEDAIVHDVQHRTLPTLITINSNQNQTAIVFEKEMKALSPSVK